MKKLYVFATMFLALTACENLNATNQQQAAEATKKSVLKRIADNVKRSGDVQAAAQMEAKIIEMDQHDPHAFIDLADSVKNYGSKADVLDILHEGEKKNPDSAEIKIALAKIDLEDNYPEKALAKLEEIKGNKTRDYYNFKGVALDLQGDYANAQTTYKEGLKEYQRDSLLLNNMALSMLLSKDYAQAVSILEELAERNNGGKYAQNLALAYGMKGDTEKARKILGRDLTAEEIEENLRIYKELR